MNYFILFSLFCVASIHAADQAQEIITVTLARVMQTPREVPRHEGIVREKTITISISETTTLAELENIIRQQEHVEGSFHFNQDLMRNPALRYRQGIKNNMFLIRSSAKIPDICNAE